MTDPDILDWQLADVLTDEHMLFILWTVKSLFCMRREDFLREYDFEPNELDALLHRLKMMGFLQEDNAELVLTEMGKTAVSYLHTTPTVMAEQKLARVSEDVQARFNLPKESIYVEQRLIEQLQQLGWHYSQERDPDTPYLAAEGRSTYRDVLLKDRLKQAIRRINAEEGKPLLTDRQIDEAITTLEQVQPPGSGLLEANKEGLRLLLEGTYVSGTPDYLNGTNRHVRFIDIEHPYNNDFFMLNQFRIELPGRQTFIVPDIVLFVNGIPLVVIECKSPDLTEPIEAAVAQLHRYASQEEGKPSLFHFNVFLIASCFYLAKAGSIGASAEEYQEWKDPYPRTQEQLAQSLGVNTPDHLSSQQVLVAGMLHKENLLDLLHNFILFRSEGDRMVKLLARYQQFRAVQKAIQRLQHGALKTADHDDERGGIIWHTQGSGKSLTMVFLIRKMRKTPGLSTFKIVVITDRRDLQDQLKGTITLTAERIREAQSIEQARAMLTQHDSGIYFVMIQKARGDTNSDQDDYEGPTLPILNDSPNILLIVDEAHRSHTSTLHGNITKALPYSAKIGFTGTPIMMGTLNTTQHIFGPFLDKYTILEAEHDGATVPILYEGYQAFSIVVREEQLDQSYAYLTQAIPLKLRQHLENFYANEEQVLEAQELIEAKARHMLLHYTANILPNRFKAMIVANSREAAVRYHDALERAKQHLIETLNQLDPTLLSLSPQQRTMLPQGTQMLLQAYAQRDLLPKLEIATVISADEDDEDDLRKWSDETNRDKYIEQFKLPLIAQNGHMHSNLALMCVQRMLLTGFDAPPIQGLYLDQRLTGHTLLQAVARVNRPYNDKTYGLVVDYRGIARQLKETLLVYSAEDIEGAMFSIQDELLKLDARYLRVQALFKAKGIDINTIDLRRDREIIDQCLNLLKEGKFRADFEEKLKKFLESMDAMLPRPEAMQYVHAMQVLGYINKSAANFLPGEYINIRGTGKKVRKLIDEHIAVLGIEQTIAPISITDTNFESKVDLHVSDETQASLMEHLARYYISEHYEEDPIYYEQLSQRLKDILERLKGQWGELVAALRPYIRDLRQPRKPDETGLDPRTELPFLGILETEVSKGSQRFNISLRDNGLGISVLTPTQRMELAGFTRHLVEKIREYIRRVDFWRGYQGTHNLRADIMDFLDENEIITPYERTHEVANRLIYLARHLHRWLVA